MHFFNVFFFFFFFFFWAANVSDLSRSQLWNMELDFGWTRYKAEHKELKKFVVHSVSLVCHTFSCIFWQASHKKLEKNHTSKKNSNFEFCWTKRTPKNKCARQLWDIGFIFFSLMGNNLILQGHFAVWEGNFNYEPWKQKWEKRHFPQL